MEMPDFLQSKQNFVTPSSNWKSFFQDKKKLGILIVLLLAIPFTVWLIQKYQIFSPKAENAPIELVTGTDSCVTDAVNNKVTCASFPIRLTSSLGPPATASASTAPSTSPSPSPSASLSASSSPSPSPSVTSSVSPSPSPSPSVSVSPSPSSSVFNYSSILKNIASLVSQVQIFMKGKEVFAQANTINDGLVAYWKMDETSGNTVTDLKGVLNGTATGTAINEGKFGKARGFVSDNEQIDMGVSSVLGNSDSFSASAWVMASGFPDTATIIRRLDQPANQAPSWLMGTTGNKARITIVSSEKNCLGTSALALNTWYLITATYDRTSLKIYVNGQLENTCAENRQVNAASGRVYIGFIPSQANNSKSWRGKIDEVGIWNRALTQTEIQSLLNGVIPGASASPTTTASPSPAASSSTSCPNLIKNTSFENPVIVRPETNNTWQLYEANPGAVVSSDYYSTTKIPDWDPKPSNAPYQVELQKMPTPADGLQYAEIDIPGKQALAQTIATENAQYQIKFWYSSRTQMPANYIQKLGVYWNDTLVGTIQGQSGQQTLSWQEKTFTVQGVAGSSKLSFGALSDSFAGAGNFIDKISVTKVGNCDSSPSPSVSSSASASPTNLPGTTHYRLAETEDGLEDATKVPYTNHPTLTTFTFSDSTPGTKQIWVEFFAPDGSSKKEHISVTFVEPDPQLTSLDCSMDISRQNLILTLKGVKLGSSGGKVTVNAKDAQITSWGDNEVRATIKPDGSLDTGREFKVVMTRKDGNAFPQTICQVDTALISLGARLFCRAPGQFDVNSVKAVIVDENGNKVNEELTIDADGIVKGLKTRLQVGKPFTLSLKAPYSLRKNADFIAGPGTMIVRPRDDEAFVLPVGDIAPVVLPDGKINVPDRAELVRQWSVLGSGNNRTGDFNRDTKVNSIDWACMRFDFNKEDEKIPDKAVGGPTPSSTPTSSSASSSTPAASASTAASASPSGRAAFFLLDPLEGGSYINDDEFIVDINISSETENANLFAAKLSFDKTALEVVRIERGTALTSWAEEFFDNNTGQISLVAGLPSPGLKTPADAPVRMARLILKGKKVGTTNLTLTSDSKIYSNADNANILSSLLSTQIEITN